MSSKASMSYTGILYIIVLCTCSLVLTVVDSEVINVGGPDRWNDSTDYVSWAQPYNFTVGDVLVFKYTPGAHNVYDVTMATFRSCDPSTGVNAMYESGDDQIVLKEAKQYWFICTVNNHCQLGMKLAVNVSAAPTNLGQTGNSPSAQPDSNGNSAPRGLIRAGNFLLAAGLLSTLSIIG